MVGELIPVQHTGRAGADDLKVEVQVDELEHVAEASVGRGDVDVDALGFCSCRR